MTDTPEQPPQTQVAVSPEAKTSLVQKIANRYGVDDTKLLNTLKMTCFKTKESISDAQMMALLIVSDQYQLNPFTKEIFAFPDKGSIIPVVSVDGWSRIINSHPALDGIDFKYADEMVTIDGESKECPAWCEVTIHRKDRSNPTTVREYLDEVYRAPFIRDGKKTLGPWQTHTKRFLRHKTLIQGARIAFGFAGIFDEDEANRIREAGQPQNQAHKDRTEFKSALDTLNGVTPKNNEVIDADFTETKEQENNNENPLQNTDESGQCNACYGAGVNPDTGKNECPECSE